MIERLQTGGFFACHCQQPSGATINVGILVIDYSRHNPGDWVDLINPDGEDRFTVVVPDVSSCPAFDVDVEIAPF